MQPMLTDGIRCTIHLPRDWLGRTPLHPILGVTVVASKKLKGLANSGPSSLRHFYEVRARFLRSVGPGAPHSADSADSSGCDCGEHVAEVTRPARTTTTTRHLREPTV